VTAESLLFGLTQLGLLALAVEALTELTVAAKIFDPIRNWIFDRAFPQFPNGEPKKPSRFWTFIVDLTKCGYCVSVWPSFPFAFFAPSWFEGGFLSWCACLMVNWMVIHRLSNWIHILYARMQKGRVLTYDIELKTGDAPWKPSTESTPDKQDDLTLPR
jgi:hypothetical protein